MRGIVILANRNLLDLDLKAHLQGLLRIFDNSLYADTLTIYSGCDAFFDGHIRIRNEAKLCGAMLELKELVFGPGRSKTCDSIWHTDYL